MMHHNLVMDFSNLDFEKIDTEILPDEAKELEETDTATAIARDVPKMGSSDLGKMDGAVSPIAE